MNRALLDVVTAAVRRARLSWDASHAAGAMEAGREPDAYLAHVAVRAMLDWLEQTEPD